MPKNNRSTWVVIFEANGFDFHPIRQIFNMPSLQAELDPTPFSLSVQQVLFC